MDDLEAMKKKFTPEDLKNAFESEYEKQARIKRLLSTVGIIKSGYAGVLSNGEIVDRRDFPEAIPCQKNSLLNTPEPKPITK